MLVPRKLQEWTSQAQEKHLTQESSLLDGAPGITWLSGNCCVCVDLHSHTENQTCRKHKEYIGYPGIHESI